METDYLLIAQDFGTVDSKFLGHEVSVLNPAEPITVREGDSVKEVLRTLKELNIGSVLVVDDNGQLSGIFTERDAMLKVLLSDLSLEDTAISQVMTANPQTAHLSTTVAITLHQMSKGGFRHVPVVDEGNVPIGLISVKDIVDFITAQLIQQLARSTFSD